MRVLDAIRLDLRGCQQPDGGFGARAGLPSRTEPTALAALALADDPAAGRAWEAAVTWLGRTQREDGSWPSGLEVPGPSWATALASLALDRSDDDRRRALRGARWLVDQEGRRPDWRARLTQRLRGSRVIDQDPSLRGWAWAEDASSWVEPTAYTLLALRSFVDDLPRRARSRIEEGERLLYDRMCPGGGWNYGNSRVLDEALEPYPDTTAIALLALRDRADDDANRRSLETLERLLHEHDSGLALAWGVLCLEAYGHETREPKARLEASFEARRFLGDARSLALASLALTGGAQRLGART